MAELTPKQHKALAALMSSATIGDAASAVGVGERTIWSWLKQPDFAAAYRDCRREATTQAIAQIQQISSAAVARLQQLLDCGKPTIELGAARTILEFAVKAVELEDIAARLSALEERVASEH